MLASSREQQSGIQLEVNEKILDSCNNLMKVLNSQSILFIYLFLVHHLV